MDWRAKVGLYEAIRREYEFGVGTIQGVATKFRVHRRMAREAIAKPGAARCIHADFPAPTAPCAALPRVQDGLGRARALVPCRLFLSAPPLSPAAPRVAFRSAALFGSLPRCPSAGGCMPPIQLVQHRNTIRAPLGLVGFQRPPATVHRGSVCTVFP